MKKIVIINTGGTFSSRPTENGLAPVALGDEIKKVLSEYQNEAEIEAEDFCSLDSANIVPEDWRKLAERVTALVGKCDGIIIIHGTDTMAYTSSMLSFMLRFVPVPVVLTGSQLPLYAPLTDAADNLKLAMMMVLTGVAGVFLAFNRKVMLGCRVSKVRTVSFDAFESINISNVGESDAFGLRVRNHLKPKTGEFSPNTKFSDKIAVLKLFPGMDPEIFALLRKNGYEGIYIEGFGLGGVPFLRYDLTKQIKYASDYGIPILVGSQCRYEGSNLNVYETGHKIIESGGIPVKDMTQEAVVTKLMWCLGQTKDRDRIKEMFEENMVGEVTK